MNLSKYMHNSGIGTDIEDINGFKKIDINGNSSFSNNIFTKTEVDCCFTIKDGKNQNK
tara:strand:+ start:706 stop:879 length:174 start_codon:yes stop_codon:yes gene_type:complete